MNLIYVHDPSHRTWLIGYDWSGKSRATVKVDPGSMGVLAFSGDKSLALVTLAPLVGGQPAHLGVGDLSTGAVVWQDDGTTVFDWFVVQPGGRSFALSYSASGQPGPGPATVLIVSGDGTAIKLGVYSPTWW